MDDLFIKRLNKNEYDVFTGIGWGEWTRIRRFHWGVQYVAGKRLSRDTVHELNNRLVK